jgi:hypothetical protein
MVNVAMLRINPSDPNFASIKKHYKVSALDNMTPKMRFYPNVKIGGKKKLDSSSQIMFDKAQAEVDNI